MTRNLRCREMCLKLSEMCALKLHLKCACWNCTWNVCVETALGMCVLKLCLRCVCWNWPKMCVSKLYLKTWRLLKTGMNLIWILIYLINFRLLFCCKHTFQIQFQHTHFKYSFNTHISGAVSTHTFQVQFQHTHFRLRHLKTHISGGTP